MAQERKYREEEAREIFGLAVSEDEVGRLTVSDEDDGGLTLAELQEVGLEVGVEPGRIAEAARAIAARGEVLPRRTVLGVPVAVGRTVDLPTALTDREWEVLVGELRETFGARGRIASHGGIREWTNGNLHVFLEPTATGARLRMNTRKGSAMALFTVGIAGLVFGLSLITLFVFEELGRAALVIPVLMAAAGGGVLVSNLLRLPRWARKREDQMERIAGSVVSLPGERPDRSEDPSAGDH
ncbi:MAG: hypothetical protein ACC682_11465 [Gemmatimonadota bacterium]